MDVHHHPDLKHEKKKIKEYLLEFLMIFLAVTMGFFAESIRESLNDHASEKEYIHHLKENLVSDTVNLNLWIPALYQRINDFDTLIKLLEIPGNTNRGSEMYYLARLSTRIGTYVSNDNTIMELKNSGNFRLIRKQNIIDELLEYEKIKESYEGLYSMQLRENDLTYPLIGNLFDSKVFDQMLTISDTSYFNESDFAVGSKSYTQAPKGNPQLRNHDADKINLLIYYLHQRKSSFNAEILVMKKQKQKVNEIIDLLNKEYNLKNQ
ncbi:MAG: hypothetical protein JSS67_03380 [Bacteroidetes bacterium]|nr:hypothetical protein [Bacteroidota bacterium]